MASFKPGGELAPSLKIHLATDCKITMSVSSPRFNVYSSQGEKRKSIKTVIVTECYMATFRTFKVANTWCVGMIIYSFLKFPARLAHVKWSTWALQQLTTPVVLQST